MGLGRTSTHWKNFVKNLVVAEEWREKFRMGSASLCRPSKELCPFIEGKVTHTGTCLKFFLRLMVFLNVLEP